MGYCSHANTSEDIFLVTTDIQTDSQQEIKQRASKNVCIFDEGMLKWIAATLGGHQGFEHEDNKD